MNGSAIIDQEARFLDFAVQLRYLDLQQADMARRRQSRLRHGLIRLSIGQVLLEQGLISPGDLRTLSDEWELLQAQEEMRAASKAVPGAIRKRFGKFELAATLSDFGYTRVYKAWDGEEKRWVALKVLPPHIARGTRWADRFRREMFLVANLSHPNVARAYECGSVDQLPFIAVEFIEGTSIAECLDREGNIQEMIAWMTLRDVAEGLSFLESHGIVHRDLKPDNILCGHDGTIKIIDMGLAKSLIDTTDITMSGETVGTAFYMSPEQAQGTQGLDIRSDFYALGCTAFHMLTGSVPFFSSNATDVMMQQCSAPRPDPRELLPEITDASAHLIQTLMAIRPDERPQNAAEVIRRIDNLIPLLPQPDPAVRVQQTIRPSCFMRAIES